MGRGDLTCDRESEPGPVGFGREERIEDPIEIPPLRERRGDIRPIAEALLARIARELHKDLVIPEPVMRILEQHDWPGNVRELENALMRAAVLARSSAIASEELSLGSVRSVAAVEADDPTLAAAILSHAEHVLSGTGGNKRQAARVLDISRQRLDRILARDPAVLRSNGGDETGPAEGQPAQD